MCCKRHIFVLLEGCCSELCREVFARIVRVVGSRLPSLRLCDLCFESVEWEETGIWKSYAVLLATFFLVQCVAVAGRDNHRHHVKHVDLNIPPARFPIPGIIKYL